MVITTWNWSKWKAALKALFTLPGMTVRKSVARQSDACGSYMYLRSIYCCRVLSWWSFIFLWSFHVFKHRSYNLLFKLSDLKKTYQHYSYSTMTILGDCQFSKLLHSCTQFLCCSSVDFYSHQPVERVDIANPELLTYSPHCTHMKIQ